MKRKSSAVSDRTAALIDQLRSQYRVLAQAQAEFASLMVHFADARRVEDKQYIAHRSAEGLDAHYKAGEFAAREISMAVTSSKRTAERTAAMSRRLQAEAPDAWDAWRAGDIDQEKAVRINRALRLLVTDRSKELLNTVVVDVAICRTPEILGRWLNQFIARVEPDETDERLNRSLDDRYVSIRPDLNGVSFLFAAMSAVDATAVDQVLTALAAAAEPGDLRTLQQRRADALVDVLLGRVSNGCHVYWDTNDDGDDYLDDHIDDRNEGKSPFAGDSGDPPADRKGATDLSDEGRVDRSTCDQCECRGTRFATTDDCRGCDTVSYGDAEFGVSNATHDLNRGGEAQRAGTSSEAGEDAELPNRDQDDSGLDGGDHDAGGGGLHDTDRDDWGHDSARDHEGDGHHQDDDAGREDTGREDTGRDGTDRDDGEHYGSGHDDGEDDGSGHDESDNKHNSHESQCDKCDGDESGSHDRHCDNHILSHNGGGTVGKQRDDCGSPSRPRNHRATSSASWDAGDWDLPESAFRPDPRNTPPEPDNPRAARSESPPGIAPGKGTDPAPAGRARIAPCPAGGYARPLPVTVGVVVSIQSLYAYTNSPAQLADRSALVPADTVRDLAAQPGTLFYRLLTDARGNLLDVTEMGRFPSRKLGNAIRFRDGVCDNPACTVSAARCDLDHLIPVPEGMTTGSNLGPKCRCDHRAKTHAGHVSVRTGPHTTRWTTPTGHSYFTDDEPLPVEEFPGQP